jgi:hypothetical protein
MNKYRLSLALVMLASTALVARAGIFFGKKTKPNPAERVPVLIAILKSEQDERKRAAAAQELREYDPNAYPEIVPVLIDALQHDPKDKVRSEAVQSLGKLRPVSQQAGMAMEEAAANDASMRVRLQARSTLWQYHVSGYRNPKKDDAPAPATNGIRTDEPPLAPPLEAEPPAINPVSPPPQGPPPAQSRRPILQRLIPVSSSQPQPVPVSPPILTPPPSGDGIPDLTPPK